MLKKRKLNRQICRLKSVRRSEILLKFLDKVYDEYLNIKEFINLSLRYLQRGKYYFIRYFLFSFFIIYGLQCFTSINQKLKMIILIIC